MSDARGGEPGARAPEAPSPGLPGAGPGTAWWSAVEAAHEGALLATVLASTTDLVFAKGLDGRYVVANDAMARLLGVPCSEIVGRTDDELFPPDVAAALRDNDHLVLSSGEALKAEESAIIDGELVTYQSTKTVWRDADGRVRGIVGVSTDVTARARAEQAVREREEEFRTLADNIPQLAWMADASGALIWLNRRWLEYTGSTLEQMRGSGWAAVHHPAHFARVRARLERSWATGEPWEDTFPMRARDGTYRWFLSRALPIRDRDGLITRWFGTNTDITAELESAEERERLLRDAQQARADAEDAREQAEAANRAKSQFLATMSHELRTPLNAIQGHVQLVELGVHGPLTAAQRDALARVQKAQRHLLRLINDVLNFARLEAGRVEYDVGPVHVRDVLADVAPLVQPQFGAKGIAFEVRLPEDGAGSPVRVLADREKLGQVLVNLLGNAAKFTPHGGRVLVTLERVPDSPEHRTGRRERAALTVADTGVGIPPEKLPYVFDPFVQAHVGSAFTRQHEGSGLGLAISRDLVRGMDGELTVWSEVGTGTSFTLLLPLAA